MYVVTRQSRNGSNRYTYFFFGLFMWFGVQEVSEDIEVQVDVWDFVPLSFLTSKQASASPWPGRKRERATTSSVPTVLGISMIFYDRRSMARNLEVLTHCREGFAAN